MIFHYAGKYDGDESCLPNRKHVEGCVKFKEPEDIKRHSLIANGISILILVLMLFFLYLRGGCFVCNFSGIILSAVLIVPHELLHGVLFKKDVYMYTNFKRGMAFLIGTEDMSKSRFIMINLFPNIVFGFIPFIIFMINPNLTILGTLGAFSIGMGAGDYLNVFYALTQMPKGAKTYLCGLHSYWYEPFQIN